MDEFTKALAQVKWPEPFVPRYRIYYDPGTGNILDYTMDDLPGTWIEVDRETFHLHRFDRKVRDGRLMAPRPQITKLRPDTQGTACDPSDITVVVDPGTHHIKWSMRTNAD